MKTYFLYKIPALGKHICLVGDSRLTVLIITQFGVSHVQDLDTSTQLYFRARFGDCLSINLFNNLFIQNVLKFSLFYSVDIEAPK